MEILLHSCCGLDVHKDMIQACVLVGDADETPTTYLESFGTMPDDLSELAQWLKGHACERVAMESTGVYWEPIYNVLEDAGFRIDVVNARYMSNMPGRKTDVKDAQWIADLLRHGLLKPSYVPERNIRILREFTRTYKTTSENRARELLRVEKLLQQKGFKLSTVLSDISGTTGRRILEHLIAHGSISAQEVMSYAVGPLKHTDEEIALAVKGKLTVTERSLLKIELEGVDFLEKQLEALLVEIRKIALPYQVQMRLLQSIPGIGEVAAYEILAETGADLSKFKTAEHLASWAGLSPRNNQSAGKKTQLGSCPETHISSAY